MDFSYSEEQEAVRELADRIFTERVTHERLKDLEAAAGDEGPIDRELWAELATAGLLGIHLGEDVGGAGLDFVAACLVVEAAGRTAAYVPVVETMVYGALPIERCGTEAQRKIWLSGVASSAHSSRSIGPSSPAAASIAFSRSWVARSVKIRPARSRTASCSSL